MNPAEVPTYEAPDGVHGPTLGRDLPDGCERASAYLAPDDRRSSWYSRSDHAPLYSQLYWWRFPPASPLKVGDRVQLTGTVTYAGAGGAEVRVDGGNCERWLPTATLTRVVES